MKIVTLAALMLAVAAAPATAKAHKPTHHKTAPKVRAVAKPKPAPVSYISRADWGETADHQKVDLYTLTNAKGASARITNYGAFLVDLHMPDRKGKMANVV
ncbi:MAG TPA: hypothetical protein VFQ52_03250, partial [Rhizomicrobium sp.]|nr:hypothetical protein [Rhizomicrobium sp.]